jgi:hypothetical protein
MRDALTSTREADVMIRGRPVGIAVLAVLLMLAAFASLTESVELVITSAGAWPAATLGAVIGLLLLYRAYALWNLRHFAWLMTTLVLGLKAAISVLEIIRGYASPGAWLTLSLAAVIILYLLHPSIKALFLAGHDDR